MLAPIAALLVAGLAASQAPGPSTLHLTRLRCEYRVCPLGIDAARPRLSWILESPERGQRQTAYRILVARSSAVLSADRGDLWDSGKVPSDESIHVVYGGKPLPSGTRAFWKVRAWDRDGKVSPWSRTAFWQMGLLGPEDWKAAWIADPAAVPPAVAARNGYHCQLAAKADTARWVAVDLGKPRTFDRIALFPARPFDWKPDTPGFLFPLRFRLEVADDAAFKSPRTVLDRTAQDVKNPGTDPLTLQFPPVTARCVRLAATRLRLRDAGHFGLALAELQVLDGKKNLAAGAPVAASDSIESANWSKAFLVDGDTVSHAGNHPEAQPATMLRKEFTLAAGVRRATLHATALGLYEFRLNGRRVGDRVLAPEWTDYHRRVQYQTYDVTSLLRPGPNAAAAVLGEGWYAGRIGMSDGIMGILRRVYGAKPRLLAQLAIELDDGRRLTISTDGSWKATRDGPIRSSDLLDGELYDARREMPGWDRPGFDAAGWKPAEVRRGIAARLVAQPNEPIRVTRELKAASLSEPKPGVCVFDLGQNMVGRCRLKLQGPAGTTVTVRHAEMLQDDGTIYTANLRGAPQVDRVILRGGGVETHEPAFTQHGFRYVELTGLKKRPSLDAVTGRVFHSAAREVARFECSSDLLNRLWRNILWTQRANLMSVPTDCPQRDERLGWMGDIQAFCRTAVFNMNLAAFFTKWLRDVRDAQADDGRYPDFAPQPYDPNTRFSGVPAWGDAGVVVPWCAYVHYGDRRLLEEHIESAKRWVEYIRSRNPDLIWRKARHNDYNDWLCGDTIRREGWPTRGAMVPQAVFATAFFAHSADLVGRMAAVLGRGGEARRYRELFENIKKAFLREFVTPDGRIQGDTQAGYALALRFDLLPPHLRPRAVEHLLEGIRRYKGHISTGIQSTHRMMLELVRAGHEDVAWRLLTSRDFPSWGYMIENGATTIWERWDGYVKGRGFQNPGMNSFNHWALGSVGEWMARHVLGIQADDEHPGFRRFTIHPRPGGGVTWARGSHDSIRGLIETSWAIDGGTFRLGVTVPAGTVAEVHVPAARTGAITESGKPARSAPGVKLLRVEGTSAVFEVGSGRYEFTARQRPISLHPDNPHYFLFRGKPTVLITSGEHYGAVLNRDFDHARYLETLRACGLNHTRTFSGAYFEPAGAFKIAQNTLAPARGRFLGPWARSSTPGAADGGNKFDLSRWSPEYFARLKDFLRHASRCGVVVEMNLFCPFYSESQWKISPLNAANNVNGAGKVRRTEVYTLEKNGGLLAVQEAMVRRIVSELKDFDNLTYEICNEPYFGGVTLAWQRRIADVIVDAEKRLRWKHLISRNVANGSARIQDPHRAISIFNFHYATPPAAVALNYGLDKVIGDNETGFKGTGDRHYRTEGWEFILAGGGLYNNLDYSFTVGHEDGTFAYPPTQPGGGSASLRRQLRILKDFIESFEFTKMRPADKLLVGGVPQGARARVLAQEGKAYAVYITGGKEAALKLRLPPGAYRAQWVDPLTGRTLKEARLEHSGGAATLPSPQYAEDAALRLVHAGGEHE